jgi:hypothetical protein
VTQGAVTAGADGSERTGAGGGSLVSTVGRTARRLAIRLIGAA